MTLLWATSILLYLTLACCLRSQAPWLFRLFVWLYLLRSLIRVYLYFADPAAYSSCYWPLYWLLVPLAALAVDQCILRGELALASGFFVYYGLDFGLRAVPTCNPAVQLVKMLPASIAALFWLFVEVRHAHADRMFAGCR